jgi:parallel beta-helix repeat protein
MFGMPKRFFRLGTKTQRGQVVRKRARSKEFSGGLRVESLEERRLLAVDAAYVDDYQSLRPLGPPNEGGDWRNTNTDKGVLVVTIDGTDNVQDVFLRVRNGNYQFATDVSFAAPFFTMADSFSKQYQLQTKDPNTTGTTPVPPEFGLFTSTFQTILVQGDGLQDDVHAPSFTVVGASNDVTKTLVVSLLEDDGSPVSNSLISIGAPVEVAAATASGVIGYQVAVPGNATRVGPGVIQGGQVYLESESVSINAGVTSQNDVSIWSVAGDTNRNAETAPVGIAIRQDVQGNGPIFMEADAVGMNVLPGGSISGVGDPATSAASRFTLDLRDTDAVLAGEINANEHSYWLERSFGGEDVAKARTITTKATSTGSQSGRIIGEDLVIYLANVSVEPVAEGDPQDGTVDIATSVDQARITSAAVSLETSLDYDITVSNDRSIRLDSVMASQGDMTYIAEAGTVTLDAAIETVGSFTLQSAADLVVESEIRSSSNVSLVSTAGSVTTRAAIITQEAATDAGSIVITAAQNIEIDSLIRAEFDGITVTATAGSIQSSSLTDPISRLQGSNAILTAQSGISVGTRIADVTASVSQAGDILINDDFDDRDDPTVEPPASELQLNSLTTVDGSITVTAIQDIDAAFVSADGSGDVSLTTTEGDIFLDTVSATGNGVVLSAVGWKDEFDFYETGYIEGDEISITANEVDWTARQLPDATIYQDIPVISARLLAGGEENNIIFTANGTTTLKEVIADDGKVAVTSQFGSIIAGRVEGIDGGTATDSSVTLTANAGDMTLSSFQMRDGSTASGVRSADRVSINVGRSILDDGDVSTIGILSNDIELRAAGSNVSGDIGSESARVSFGGASEISTVLVDAVGGSLIDPTNIFLEGTSSATLTADASSKIDVITTGAVADLEANDVAVSDIFGSINLGAGRDLIVGSAEVGSGGFFMEGSSISLAAGRYILNQSNDPNQTTLLADELNLVAASLDGQFNAANLDSIRTVSASATLGTGQVNLAFDRANPITLEGVQTIGGAIAITNTGDGALLVGQGGVTAGTGGVSGSVVLNSATTIGVPDNPSDQGVVSAPGIVNLTADDNIVAKTAAGILGAGSVVGSITLSQTGDVRLSELKTDDANGAITLDVTGSILVGSGPITAEAATLSATTGLWALTDVKTLSASSDANNLTIIESDELEVGLGGLSAPAGEVSVTVMKGAFTGANERIEGLSVDVELLEAGNELNILTSTSSLAAKTAGGDGDITVRNDQTFSIGASGVIAGSTSAGWSDVTLATTAGAISQGFGNGSIFGDELTVTAVDGIDLSTSVNTLNSVRNAVGDIVISQRDKAVTVDDVVAAAGDVTITNNNAIALTFIEAGKNGQAVTISATGGDSIISLGSESIFALGGEVSLAATGGIDGTDGSNNDITAEFADIHTKNVTLAATGDITATVAAETFEASATGTDSNTAQSSVLELTAFTSTPVFLGTGNDNSSSAYASGDNSVTVLDAEDPSNVGQNIIVAVTPESPNGDVELNTLGDVTFAVTNSAAQGDGSLTWAIDQTALVDGIQPGTTDPETGEPYPVIKGASFATSVRDPIKLSGEIQFNMPIVLDGTSRIDVRTGLVTTGRYVDIDGARVPVGDSGFKLEGDADNSTIRGLAFSEFRSDTPAIKLVGTAIDAVDGVSVEENIFGVSSTGRLLSNSVGLAAEYADNLTVRDNVFAMSREAGVSLGTNVTNATVVGNFVGTDSRGRNLANVVGIELDGAGAGNVIGGDTAEESNLIEFNGIGVSVSDTTGTAASKNTVKGNAFERNGTGVEIGGSSSEIVVEANTIVLGAPVDAQLGDGIVVSGTASAVTIGGAADSLGNVPGRNFIGTNETTQLGLGNQGSGVRVSSSGETIEVLNNTIFGNNVAGGNEAGGITLEGSAGETTVEGNNITANAGSGVFVADGAEATIISNLIQSNDSDGVTVQNGAVATIGASASEANDDTVRLLANTIHSNGGYGIHVPSVSSIDGTTELAQAFADYAGNSLAGNSLGNALNKYAAAPTISSANITTPRSYTGGLRVTFSGLTAGQVVSVYVGGQSGSRTYLGRVVAAGSTAVFVMSRQQQIDEGVDGEVYVGSVLSATATTLGSPSETSSLTSPFSIRRS